MKKLLGIVVLGLLLSGNSYSKDLSGTKLNCLFIGNKDLKDNHYLTLEFINSSQVQELQLITNSDKPWGVYSFIEEYSVHDEVIKYGLYKIDRETLELKKGYISYQCINFNDDWNPLIHLKIILENIKREQKKKNKI